MRAEGLCQDIKTIHDYDAAHLMDALDSVENKKGWLRQDTTLIDIQEAYHMGYQKPHIPCRSQARLHRQVNECGPACSACLATPWLNSVQMASLRTFQRR